MTNPLVYTPAAVPEDCVFKISPSAFSNFIDKPHKWYRNEVLNEDVFTHNTSSVIGTIVHYCAESVANGDEVSIKYIEEYVKSLELNEDYDPDVVLNSYREMAETLVNDYVIDRDFMEVETQYCFDMGDGFYVAGTIDRLEGCKSDCMIVDYKTYHSKIKPKTIPSYYKYQLLTYAAILKSTGYNVTRIRLVYVNRNIEGDISEKTGKRLKSYPPEVTIITETINEEDIEFIESQLELCVDSLILTEQQPDISHIIWHDPRLKNV